jgi:hypothetical protein
VHVTVGVGGHAGSGGPPPEKLGFNAGQVPHVSGSAAAGISKAKQFGQPSGAAQLGGHLPTHVAGGATAGAGGHTTITGTSATPTTFGGHNAPTSTTPTTTTATTGTVHPGATGTLRPGTTPVTQEGQTPVGKTPAKKKPVPTGSDVPPKTTPSGGTAGHGGGGGTGSGHGTGGGHTGTKPQ